MRQASAATPPVLGASGHIAGAINPASRTAAATGTSDSGARCREWLEAAVRAEGQLAALGRVAAPEGATWLAARNKPGNGKYKMIAPAVKETGLIEITPRIGPLSAPYLRQHRSVAGNREWDRVWQGRPREA